MKKRIVVLVAMVVMAVLAGCDQVFNIETMNVYVREDSTWVPVPDSTITLPIPLVQ